MEILCLFPAVLRLVGHRGLGHLSIVCLWRVYMSVKTLVLLTGHDQVMNFCCMSNQMSTVKIKPDVVIANGPQEENYFTSIKTNVLMKMSKVVYVRNKFKNCCRQGCY